MQYRMKEIPLTDEQIGRILKSSVCGRLGTMNEDGYPYVVAVHFVYHEGCIYIHGLHKGQKFDNIRRNFKVCFEIDEMQKIPANNSDIPSSVKMTYKSVIILGDAILMEDLDLKREVLNTFVEKYTPELMGIDLQEDRIRSIAVIEIMMRKTTGRFYK